MCAADQGNQTRPQTRINGGNKYFVDVTLALIELVQSPHSANCPGRRTPPGSRAAFRSLEARTRGSFA